MALTSLSTGASPDSSLLAPPSTFRCPYASRRDVSASRPGPRHSCAQADGRAGQPEEMANMLGGGLLEEVLYVAEGEGQRVDIMATAPA